MASADGTRLFSSALLGGSFDPPHLGHVAVARYISVLLAPDELRILPAGNPWQKPALFASPDDRMEMARLAFGQLAIPVVVDRREIDRIGPTYTADTLRELRAELGPRAAMTLVIGADQLQRLNTWREWRSILELAHLCAVSRPGFALALESMPHDVRREFVRRAATPDQLRATSHGLCHVAEGVAADISSTMIRNTLREGSDATRFLPPAVLDYIQQHQLYRH